MTIATSSKIAALGSTARPSRSPSCISMARPMRSTKLLRLPQRGALGNGLRVVAGTVFASEGSLAVITRNKRIELQPLADGTTKVVSVKAADRLSAPGSRSASARRCQDGSGDFSWARSALKLPLTGKSIEGCRAHTGTTPRNSTSCCWRAGRSRCVP